MFIPPPPRILTRGGFSLLAFLAILSVVSFTQAQTTYSDTGSPNPIPSGNITTDAIFDITNTATYSGVISGSGYVSKTGAGTLTLSNSGSTFSGPLLISEGTLNATGSNGSNSDKSCLGTHLNERTITVNSGANLVLSADNVMTNAGEDSKITIVLDGGRLSNSETTGYYNYLQNLVVKDGAEIYASGGHATFNAYKLHNVEVQRNSDDSAGSTVEFSASSNAKATYSFGAKTNGVASGVSKIKVEDITSADRSVVDNVSDLKISAIITDPVVNGSGGTNKGKIIKSGAGTLELSNPNNTFTGELVISEGTLLASGVGNNGNKSTLGNYSVARTITVEKGANLVFGADNVMTTASVDSKISIVLDGGRISNSGEFYNFVPNLTVKDGATLYASGGHYAYNAYKLYNVNVERNTDGTAGATVEFASNGSAHATYSFGTITNNIASGVANIVVDDITSSDVSVVDNVTDLKISAIVTDPVIDNNGNTRAGKIVKSGVGTLEFTAANTYTGITTISAGTLKLTGDAIESIAGNITVNAGGTLEYNVAQNDERTATFTNAAYVLGNGDILKTGEGRLKINTDELDQAASDLHFTADNFVVASGRLDLEGYMLGNIEVDANTVFSPGNSIGEATFGGGYILKDGATLLLEVGKDGDDVLTDVLNVTGDTTFENGSIIKIALDSSYDNNFVEGDQADIQLPSGILGSDGNDLNLDNLVLQLGMFELVGYDSGTGILSVKLSAPAAGVPEPSTWALLALGVVVLFLRKRVRN